ncbi:hypothetical protein JTB14_000405 [Gonioctena quinquepunctata]|nr:hypothetical protein JTB14_000405 [Gonioctena quinquepunctata]
MIVTDLNKTSSKLTENALRNTRHCIMPSIVSPVRQKVPVKCLPLRPNAADVAKLACTSARRGKDNPVAEAPESAEAPVKVEERTTTGFAVLLRRSKESITVTHLIV